MSDSILHGEGKTPIRLDLDDLTQAHVDRCAPHIGTADYGAPCIIGTLSGELSALANAPHVDDYSIGVFVEQGDVAFASKAQVKEAVALQKAFDASDRARISALLTARNHDPDVVALVRLCRHARVFKQPEYIQINQLLKPFDAIKDN